MALDGMGRNDDPLEDLMRVVLHQDTVVECPRLALVGVNTQVNRARMVLGQKGPFDARGKAGAPAAAKAGVFDDLGDFVGGEAERLF